MAVIRRTMTMTMTATAALLLVGAAPAPQERVVTGDGIIEVRLNGEPIRLRIDPAAPGMPLVSDAIATQRGFRMGRKLGIGFGFNVGPTLVMSQTQVVRIAYGGGKPEKQRIGWTQRPFAAVADGSIGPGSLPEPVVRFALRPAQAGESTVTMRLEKLGFPMTLFGAGWVAAIGIVDVGGAPMRVRFDPHHARTLATAGAAVRLAQAYDGMLSGEGRATEIFFGVERPVRDLALRRPFRLGALAIDRLGARTGDFGSTAVIRDGDVAAPATDPDEIVVTAKGKKRDMRRDTISLGADQLRHCSSIVFDRNAGLVHLTCAG
ncbi:hypothetical protein [Sphingomonas insulae]|nr:hypothetical protein [Sphingomonas insulae]